MLLVLRGVMPMCAKAAGYLFMIVGNVVTDACLNCQVMPMQDCDFMRVYLLLRSVHWSLHCEKPGHESNYDSLK